jgi:hypothetical protein
MKILSRILVAGALSLAAIPAASAPAETDFLKSLHGTWTGKGSVKIRTNRSPVSVSCNFQSSGGSASLLLDGRCRGLIVVSRAITANLKIKGSKYSGSYVGAGSGTAGLNGNRSGNAINLAIRWAKEVNGDRVAMLTVQKVGDNGMKLITRDKDPATGKTVVTSEISLQRK